MSSYEEDSSDSDAEDYARDIGGLTLNQARSGEGRIKYDVGMKTFVFKHAMEHHYCSKQPPGPAIFFDLIEKLMTFSRGLRQSTRHIKAVGKWIEGNISQAKLHGLLSERLTTSVRGKNTYEIHYSLALVEAIHAPEFSYSDLHPAGWVADRHAELRRQMLPWQPSPLDHPGLKHVVDMTISWLVTTGRIVSSSNHGQRPVASVPPPYITARAAQFSNPQVHHNVAAPSTNQPSVDAYSSTARPLYAADQVRAGQNEECWRIWKFFLQMRFSQVARKDPNAAVDPYIQGLLDWNGGVLDFKLSNDYVGWLVDATYASLEQDQQDQQEQQQQSNVVEG